MGVMISGPSDVEEGAGSGDGDADEGLSVGVGGGWTASEVDVTFVDVGCGWTTSDVDVDSTGGATEREDDCGELCGGGTTDEEDNVDGAELSGPPVNILSAAEEEAGGGVDVGNTTSDVEEDPAAVDVASAMLDDDRMVELEKAADELDMMGAGCAEGLGTPGTSVVGSGVGLTVVYDVTITTGGTCRATDDEAPAGGR
jgi:hypothetical protein